jgi:glucose-1-phosphate thymidylyltransferase
MKVIILLGGYGSRMRPHTWSRPKPLLNVAGNTVLGHILDRMEALTTGQVIFVVGYKGDQIEAWVRENYPQLDSHFVIQEEALGQAHAVWLCRDYLQDGKDVVLAFGDGIIDADYGNMQQTGEQTGADAVFTVQKVDDPSSFGVVALDNEGYVTRFIEKPPTNEHDLAVVGINWFRDDRQLFDAVDRVMEEGRQTLGEHFMADAYEILLEEGAKIATMEIQLWTDAGQPQNILETNARLLSMGYNTQDAIERSYAEDFMVVPPVYIHPSARIENSVVGPYATIDAEVVVRESIVRNSIVDRAAVLENVVVDGSLIGENAEVSGRPLQLFVGDNSRVQSS